MAKSICGGNGFMYPLKFNNLYYNKVWGGRDLELFRENLPQGDIGESWDVACHPHGTSVIANGEFAGMRLDELIELKGEKLVGSKLISKQFPLLMKLINSKEKLSVQVHPDDEYGQKVEGEQGKTEAWYVLEALKGANIVVGTKKCTKEQFKGALESGELDTLLNKVEVKKGDVFFIQSGLVHAIGEGVIIAEIQQNSDTTYRVFDYNRGREIHVEKALDVIDLSLSGERSIGTVLESSSECEKLEYCRCEYFVLQVYDIKTSCKAETNDEVFEIYTCVEGSGEITWSDGIEKIKKGDSIMIPASLGTYEMIGKMKLLKSKQGDS